MKKNIAVYAGTFDPVTNGHLDIIERASRMYDHLYVTIFANPNNSSLFVPSENIMNSITNMVLSKGEHIGRGHTAYLTFATKTTKSI